ncbi:MAG: flagellar hook capping FlgD N-terminal domain-containing protein [Halocynthiibacter sp.]
MNISPTTGADANTVPNAPKKQAISSDYETFLHMLTVQMKNQDPLNPVESADFAVQLATFSNVEQQIRTNQLLTGLTDTLGQSRISNLGSWVGMQARAPMPVSFSGDPIDVTPRFSKDVESATAVIKSSSGTIYREVSIPTTAKTFTWDGKDDSGNLVPMGDYQIEIESYEGDKIVEKNMAQSYGEIIEARYQDGGVELVFANGHAVKEAEITGVRGAGV